MSNITANYVYEGLPIIGETIERRASPFQGTEKLWITELWGEDE